VVFTEQKIKKKNENCHNPHVVLNLYDLLSSVEHTHKQWSGSQ